MVKTPLTNPRKLSGDSREGQETTIINDNAEKDEGLIIVIVIAVNEKQMLMCKDTDLEDSRK